MKVGGGFLMCFFNLITLIVNFNNIKVKFFKSWFAKNQLKDHPNNSYKNGEKIHETLKHHSGNTNFCLNSYIDVYRIQSGTGKEKNKQA
jgi:hypothetical protein